MKSSGLPSNFCHNKGPGGHKGLKGERGGGDGVRRQEPMMTARRGLEPSCLFRPRLLLGQRKRSRRGEEGEGEGTQ